METRPGPATQRSSSSDDSGDPAAPKASQVLLHGVPLGPGPRGVLVLVPVRLVHVSYLGDQRIVGVWISQQGADGQQHLGDG